MALKYLHVVTPPGHRMGMAQAAWFLGMPSAKTLFETEKMCVGSLSCEKRIKAWSVVRFGNATCAEPASIPAAMFARRIHVLPLSALNSSVFGPVFGLLCHATVCVDPAGNDSQP